MLGECEPGGDVELSPGRHFAARTAPLDFLPAEMMSPAKGSVRGSLFMQDEGDATVTEFASRANFSDRTDRTRRSPAAGRLLSHVLRGRAGQK